jgi:hypothetical protein
MTYIDRHSHLLIFNLVQRLFWFQVLAVLSVDYLSGFFLYW